MSKQRNISIFVIPLCVGILGMIIFYLALLNGWFGPQEDGVGEFCEKARTSLIKEPANTWSNLGFIVSGLIIAWDLMQGKFRHNNNSLTRSFFFAVFYPSIVVLLGPGSMAKHASESYIGGFFDMLSMYLLVSFTVAYSVQRFLKLSPLLFSLLFLFILISCIYSHFLPYHIVFHFFGVTVFAFYLLLTVIFEGLNIHLIKMSHDTKWIYYALGILIVAVIIWILSKTDAPLCDPPSLIQGHAIWHILNAIALYFLFRYYVSENQKPPTKLSVY